MSAKPFAFARPLWLGEVASTNDYLKERLAAGEAIPSGVVVAAHRQTRGRGRMENEWHSSPEGDLTFSLLWRGEAPFLRVGSLPMACALGVRDFLADPPRRIESVCKWPNDVLVGGAKICGILTESAKSGVGLALVVGIGVNLRRPPDRDGRIGRITAVVEELAGPQPDAAELLPQLLGRLAGRIAQWEKDGFAGIRDDLNACLWGRGREVAARTPGGKVRGRIEGLGENGELLLIDDKGAPVRVSSVTALEGGWDV